MTGITVSLAVQTVTGTDPFGVPVTSPAWEDVDNVLVSPSTPQEITDSVTLYGKRAVYTLFLPKGDAHVWEDTEVAFFGKIFRTFGEPVDLIDHLTPGSWNRRVWVEYVG